MMLTSLEIGNGGGGERARSQDRHAISKRQPQLHRFISLGEISVDQ
jgi:hypothetical protein